MQIDGFTPLSSLRPGAVSDLGEIVRRATTDKLALYPVGGATTQQLGLPPQKPGHVVDMSAFDQVIDYPARDMTITVQAGISMAKLQAILAGENQWLPIDVPQQERATLGGAIAVNACGSRRYGYGTLRDYVIGISFMTDAGVEAKAGGRVVKNVAGYDLMKLHIGALGTLGIITQVTLKVRPRPEASIFGRFNTTTERLTQRLDRIHGSKTRPICIDVVHDAPAWQVTVGFEDNADAIRWQQQVLTDELAVDDHSTLVWDHAMPAASTTPISAPTIAFKANLLSSAAPEFLRTAVGVAAPNSLRAHAGNGIVYGHLPSGLTLCDAARILTELRKRAVADRGNLIVTHCPAAWKRELPIWGEPRGDRLLMQAVKKQLDPQDIFNPGRFVV